MSDKSKTQKKKRNRLSLQQKMEIIEKSQTHSLADLMTTYRAGKTVVYEILKRKEQIRTEWSQTKLASRMQLKKCVHESVNKAVHEWYLTACAQNLPMSRKILQQKARKISTLSSINDTSFKASNGWLESFIKRHGISFGETKKIKGPRNTYFPRSKVKESPDRVQPEQRVIEATVDVTDSCMLHESPATNLQLEKFPNGSAVSYTDLLTSLNSIKSTATTIGNEKLFTKISDCITIVESEIAKETTHNHSKRIQQTGTFKLVKTIERNGSNVIVVPEHWEKNNILYWPTHLSHIQREKLRADSGSKPDAGWTKQNCVTKMQNVHTFSEALQYEKQFAEATAQPKVEDELSAIRFQNEFLIEKFKLFETETRQNFEKFNSKLTKMIESNDCPGAQSEIDASDFDDETPIKIEYVMVESSEEDKFAV